jgi:peptidoglycan hydrolase CwlO-like protein
MKNILITCGFLFAGTLTTLALAHSPFVVYAQTADNTGTGSAPASTSSLQEQIDANTQQIASLNQQIAQYQAELQQVGANKKTLQAAISSLDLQRNKVEAQVAVTQNQIATTELQIQQIGGEIVSNKQTVTTDQVALAAYLRSLQKTQSKALIVQLLSSVSLTQAWANINATLQMQKSVQNEVVALQTQEGVLADSQAASQQKQATLASQQQSLAAQQQSLAETEQSKNQLLAETNAQESTYEKLLAAAEAELNSFSTFAENAGGSKLLPGQTQCDTWGCYYNQRDALWGSLPLDGTKYNLASDGCLVTSLAMVMTHYGYKDVTPVTINSDPNNFAAYYPAYLMTTISVDGATVTRRTAGIDATLADGTPVIIGLRAYGGTHYVVLVSGSRGNYLMRDPYIADGDDISFSAHYSLRSVFSAARVVITS